LSMKIVVVDGYTLNPGDLSWADLRALGACEIYERSTDEELLSRSEAAEILLTNKMEVRGRHIERLPKLRYIGVTATGYNIVDVVAARERGIAVTNVPAYGTASVAQMTFALLLELCHRTGHHAQTVSDGRWAKSPDFCYWDYPLVELDGLTMGIIGWGRIGHAVARLALAFGMKVVATGRSKPKDLPADVAWLDLEALLRASDVVSLHCPLTAETKQMINAQRLKLMKPTGFLLNTSRGPLIDEAAMAAALQAGQIAGAGLDVLSVEPPAADNPLYKARNCFITPHISWATRAARSRLMRVAVENVRAFIGGKPQNVVS
jgi:glycerate dehydrogenase